MYERECGSCICIWQVLQNIPLSEESKILSSGIPYATICVKGREKNVYFICLPMHKETLEDRTGGGTGSTAHRTKKVILLFQILRTF